MGVAVRAIVRSESSKDQNSTVRAGSETVDVPDAFKIRARVLRK